MIPYKAISPRDTKNVLVIIKELTVDTDTDTCMKGKYCGQETMLALQNHYDGKYEGERRKKLAKYNLKRLFYRNKNNLSFEKYVTNMK